MGFFRRIIIYEMVKKNVFCFFFGRSFKKFCDEVKLVENKKVYIHFEVLPRMRLFCIRKLFSRLFTA